MDKEMKEILVNDQEQEKKQVNPFDYVTITVKEYRKMVRKIERVKAEKDALVEIGEYKEKAEQYRRWWQEEQKKASKLEEALNEAKDQIKGLLGIEADENEQAE